MYKLSCAFISVLLFGLLKFKPKNTIALYATNYCTKFNIYVGVFQTVNIFIFI